MARQYPPQAYHHPPPTQIPHHQQAYRQDPLRGMAAMQAAHTSPMGEKVVAETSINNFITSYHVIVR